MKLKPQKIPAVFALCIILVLILQIMPCSISAMTEDSGIRPDTWTFVDGLGRNPETFGIVSAPKTDHKRAVGIFYHTWHTEFSSTSVPVNVTQVVTEHPEAAKKVQKNEFWVENFESKYRPAYFWNEPLFGYYRTQDDYVLRKHAELLADAGVDFIYIDGTNGSFMWEAGVNAMVKTFLEAKEDGVKVPQIVFWLSLSEPENRIKQLQIMYKNWYSNEKYKDLWFKWDDKPLVLCYTDILNEDVTFKNKDEIVNMFTFRPINPSYFNHGGSDPNYWGWLSVYPQCKYGVTEDEGRPEQMAVGIAQNADSDLYELTFMAAGDNVMGRSFAGKTKGQKEPYSYSYTYGGTKYTVDQRNEFATLAGRNFQQQWDYAIKCDPDVILVTGWNEWTAGRTSGFCDAFTDEYSRDIEPTKGKLKDYYYYQLTANIRRFKGASYVTPSSSNNISIDISSSNMSQWDNVTSYEHYTGSTRDRKCKGYLKTKFENFTMRNDIITSKVAYDKDNIYFYVSTKENLTPESDAAWMRLFIDTDYSGNSANWEGFEYVINRVNPSNGICTVERSAGVSESGKWQWEQIGNSQSESSENVRYTVNGNVLQIQVPRALIGLESDKIDFAFKWSDNMQADGDIMDFYSNGDVAPGGRFCFRFTNTVILHGDEIREKNNTPITLYIIIAAAALAVAAAVVIIILKLKKKPAA